ncbi:MAG TPA: ABC transporter ATP-binding protein [Marmoricola sp.]|nr:ABC transporter ATP-binding protein [Marmoricola sp.]
MDPVIELQGLRKRFISKHGEVNAVDGIDLRVERGEVVALLGPNGAGKTTTLDIVLGLTTPSEGSARVLGLAPRQAVMAGRVSAVLQSGGLLGDLTVEETVRYLASMYDEPAPVSDVMARAGITELADRRVSKCSGGEQQRLRFAVALLPEPALLILDEPTAGMDVNARREFWVAMHAEAARGRTVVFATHYLEEADDFADRIVLVDHGRVIADGPTEVVRAMATGRSLSATFVDPQIALARLGELATEVTQSAGRVTVRGGDIDAIALVVLTELGGHDLEIVSGSLDDAFVQLTQKEAQR